MVQPPHNSTSSEAFNKRGIELADRGWLEEAIREFGRAIDLDPVAPFPRINRASVLVEQGRMTEALEDLLNAVRLAPDDPASHYHLGLFLCRHGAEFGLDELQKTLDLEPDHIDALLVRGVALAERGQPDEARECLDTALEVEPADLWANRERGILALDQGQVHEAIGYLRKAREQAPKDPELAVDLGLAYVQAGFLERGAEVLAEVVEQVPEHVYAVYNLAAIHAEWQAEDQALDLLDRALALDREQVVAWLRDDPMFAGLRSNSRLVELVGS